MKRLCLIVFLSIVFLFCGCTYKPESTVEPITEQTNSQNGCLPMDASDGNLNHTVNTETMSIIEKSISSEIGEAYEIVAGVLAHPSIYRTYAESKWTDKCYISDVAIPAYNMQTHNIGDGYSLLVFCKDFSEVMQITLYRSSSQNLEWDFGELSSKQLEIFNNDPGKNFIFISNAGLIAVDETNNVYIINKRIGNDYSVTGDFYHALDYEALAVSYNEITSPEHLHEIEIVENN